MGRCNVLPIDRDIIAPKMRLQQLKWVDGDYDEFGAYWGCGGRGQHIYCAQGEHDGKEILVFARAVQRHEAKMIVREFIPHARFYR